MAGERPPIPSDIQRQVRQRCGFGCVVCGLPLYEYEHLLGWANTERHIAGEITLLCNRHHTEKTKGLLPLAEVYRANERPYNLREGSSAPYTLHFSGDRFEVVIGSNSLCQESALQDDHAVTAICIDDVPLIGFEKRGDELSLLLQLFTPANQMIIQVVNNEMVYSTGKWDVEFVGQKLTIREAARRLLIVVRFEPPDRVVVERGQFFYNGIHVEVFERKLIVKNKNSSLTDCSASGFSIGLGAGDLPEGLAAAFYSGEIERYEVEPILDEGGSGDGANTPGSVWCPDIVKLVKK